MINLLEVEIRKLRGSLVLLLVAVPPLLPGVMIALAMATNDKTAQWDQLIGQLTLPLWAMFLNPSLIATVATLMGQIEYKTNSWSFTLVQPHFRWQVFAIKLGILIGLHGLMMVLAVAGAILAGASVGWVFGNMPTGAVPWRESGDFVISMMMGSLAILVIQLWVALRWNNFILPLAIGIGGTLIQLAVLITGTRQAD